MDAGPDVSGLLAVRLREMWSALVGVEADALLPCVSTSAALQLVTQACLLPGDTVRLARPGQLSWSAAVLAAGAAYVDVGRVVKGAVDPATAVAAPPGRLAILGAPAPTGADDAGEWPPAADELRLADASLAASLHGYPVANADLTLLVLREPDAPSTSLLCALCGPVVDVQALSSLAGPALLPLPLIRAALAALQRMDHHAEAVFQGYLKTRSQRLIDALSLGPGQRWLPRAGVSHGVQCLAADGASVAAAARKLGYRAEAWSAFPGGGLVRIDLR